MEKTTRLVFSLVLEGVAFCLSVPGFELTDGVGVDDALGFDLSGRHGGWSGTGEGPEETSEDGRNGGQLGSPMERILEGRLEGWSRVYIQ